MHKMLRCVLTIPHSPDGRAESDKCCHSEDTPVLPHPLQMEGKSLEDSCSLEKIKIMASNTVKGYFMARSLLTFEYHLLM